MNWLAAIWSVFWFECRRSMTVGRITIWLGLAAFPAVIVMLLRFAQQAPDDAETAVVWDWILFALAGVVCLLSLLLWATTIVTEERSANTWCYLAVRSCGVSAVLLGKYLNAVIWSVACTLLAVTLAVAVGQPPRSLSLAGVLIALTLMGAPAYAAVFVLFGVAFDRISMAVALLYALLLEGVVATIPAVISQVTIRYRLQSLFVEWRGDDWNMEQLRKVVASDQPVWQQMVTLAAVTLVLLGVAVTITRLRELARPERG
jgi:ABC-type transport system involved in multi-copper enzyme maturation permease subunit